MSLYGTHGKKATASFTDQQYQVWKPEGVYIYERYETKNLKQMD